MIPEHIIKTLKAIPLVYKNIDLMKIKKELINLKEESQRQKEEIASNKVWCLIEICNIHTDYISAFNELKGNKFYEGWCLFAKIERNILSLERHIKLLGGDKFNISFVLDSVNKFQKLFPYKIFSSPEFKVSRKRCSICNKVVTPRNQCGHIPGQLYNGESCRRQMEGLYLLAVGLVESPQFKENVMIVADENINQYYDYSLLQYVVTNLQSPYHFWKSTETKTRHPHHRFKHISSEEPCPCESGKPYKECCLLEQGVLRPHFVFEFEVVSKDFKKGIEYLD